MVIELAGREETATVPVQYNHLVQGALYRSISPSLSAFLHSQGFLYEKRAFKLFTFSRLFGRRERQDNQLVFRSPIQLHVSSPIDQFVRELANTLLQRGTMVLGDSTLLIREVNFPREPSFSARTEIRTLSPVTVYSTLYDGEGRRKTYYYHPREEEFTHLVEANLKKKAALLTQGRRYASAVDIKSAGRVREAVVLFKGTVVKGWTGRFTLRAPKTLLRIAYETGLGSKNSQGFGMFEVVE
jgi:CRISPR-associated endoribonuclease Cas6